MSMAELRVAFDIGSSQHLVGIQSVDGSAEMSVSRSGDFAELGGRRYGPWTYPMLLMAKLTKCES